MKYEYMFIEIEQDDSGIETLNSLGSIGWHVVSVVQSEFNATLKILMERNSDD